MATRLKTSKTSNSGKFLYICSVVLAVLGFVDATYLLIYKLTSSPYMCLGSGGCHDVNFSQYSEIGGIPVSVFGMLAFLSIAGILFFEPRLKLARENGPLVIFGISLSGVAFTVYLTWLELYVIHAICPFCIASAIIILLIFILAIIRLVTQTVK